MATTNNERPLTLAAYRSWIESPFLRNGDRSRDMAYLASFEQWRRLQLFEGRTFRYLYNPKIDLGHVDDYKTPPPEGPPISANYALDVFKQTLYGWPVYVGRVNPSGKLLFLPEETIRSMANEPYERNRERRAWKGSKL
jgi:hypothetical protein